MDEPILRRNNVKVSGRAGAQPMLFAHGFDCDQTMWRAVAPAFEADHQVVLFDYVGSGQSDRSAYDPARYSSLDGYAQDVLEIIDALNLREVVFVGHSVGGIIGMLASIKAPERFSQLVLVGPSPCYINHPPDYLGGFEQGDLEGLLELMEKNDLGWASFLAPVVMGNPDRPELAAELHGSFCATDPTIARQFAHATVFSDHRREVSQVTVPSLILQPSDDAIAPATVGDYLRKHLPGTTFQPMAAVGHCPHVSHPKETVQLIQTYLNETRVRL